MGRLENEAALLKWLASGPIVSDILHQADLDFPNPQKLPKHHENTDLYEKNFRKDQNLFLGALMEYGSEGEPIICEEEPMSVQIVLKHVLNENSTSSAKRARAIGLNRFDSFINDRLWNGTASLYDNITENNLRLFRSKNALVISKSKQRIASLEADGWSYTYLFVAWQARDCNLDKYFTH